MLRALAIAILLAGGLAPAQTIGDFFKDTFEQILRDQPEYATNVGRHEYDDRWTDQSKAARAKRKQFLEERLRTLNGFPEKSLSEEDRLTAQLIRYDFGTRLSAWEWDEHLLSVGQLFGFHNRVFLTIDRMPARTAHDYENMIARMRGVPAYVEQYIGVMDEAIASGQMQPRLVADLVAGQIATQMNQDAAHTALLTAFGRLPANLPEAEKTRLLAEGTKAYETQFVPAWRKLHDYMANTYSAHVRPTDSLSSARDGRAGYALLVRQLTTTNVKPEEIHSLGEHEVARIEGEMKAVLAEAKFDGTIDQFQEKLNSSPDQHFTSKEEMLSYCRNIAKIIEPELPNMFRHIPPMLYGVRAIPPDREAATATNAQAPSADLSTPGWFNLNTYRPEKQVKYDKQSLVLHEAVPGHIFQGALAHSQANLPEIRKYYGNSAYAEGWALYAEGLGSQLDLYHDPYSRFGQLASERFRAVRLVVDTGIHELGWSRQQALDYFHAHAPEETESEIDRYISWPGQALAYKMGQLRILELRREAERQLGAKFSLRDFNDALLADGSLPLELLGQQIHAFVASAQTR